MWRLEEIGSSSSTSSELQSKRAITPRGYQLECLHKAEEENIIVCLETGCGKTLIAALLLKKLSWLFSASTPYVAVFLVPTVMLVQQQANVIKEYAHLKVGQYNGHGDGGRWDAHKWNDDVLNLEVLVMTPQILLNVLRHALLKMEAVKLLIFDECHHCQKGHPYARIMEEYYFKVETSRPKILGMTASPVIRKGKSEFQCSQDIDSLERLLDAKIITVKDRSELESIVPSPNIEVREYDGVYNSFETLQLLDESIQNIKTQKWRSTQGAIFGLEKACDDGNRNKMEGLGKIFRDVEYCLYDLGLWFARHAAQYAFCSDEYLWEETTEENCAATPIMEKNLILRQIYECLDRAILQVGGMEELKVEHLKPDLVSNKVSALVDVLLNFRSSKLKCIVFVERVVAAKVLASFLCKILKSVQCKHIVGKHSKLDNSSGKMMSKTLDDFRSGKVDLLVATNVAEEGLDVQNCYLVVQFDMPKTLRSFIQSRGRARVRSSHYIVLKDKKKFSEGELLDTLKHSESFVKDKILEGHEPFVNTNQKEVGYEYKVESTGASVNTHSSVQLLHRYCSKLPSDEFYQPHPSFLYIEDSNGIKCRIMLPSNAPIRLIEGEPCESEIAAKKMACLKACETLHLKGVLTDYLLPQTSMLDEDDYKSHHSHSFKAATEDLQGTMTPVVWRRQPTCNGSVMCMHTYKLHFDAIPGDREYASFALLLESPLPQEAAHFCETFQLRHARAVRCKLKKLQDVTLDKFQVAQAESFQSTLFSILLDRNIKNPNCREQSTLDSAWYLLLPLRLNQGLTCSQEEEIDWERIAKFKSIRDSKHAWRFATNNRMLDDTSLQFANMPINREDVPGLLVKTIHGNNLYCIIDVFADLNADSPFPNDRYKTYVDYFKVRYNHKVVLKEQPLLKARFLREVHNFLQDRSTQNDHCSAVEKCTLVDKSVVELPPEICSIEYFGLFDDLVNAAVILPSLMHRLESIVLASQLHNNFSLQFPEGSQVSVKKILEAITTQKCLAPYNLERLELLGDSFLKYAVSCHLFLAYEEADEGILSMRRSEKICNASLFTLGDNLGLPGFICDTLFDPKHWVAPCYPSEVLCNENKLEELHGASSESKEAKDFITCNKRHRWMQRKTIADSIEALIGAYLEEGGEQAALSFMKFIGLDVTTERSQLIKIQDTSSINLSLITKVNIEALEELLCYKFKHKGLLIEAFTHASFTKHLGKCYQRLEFLGDSVLDFLITRHLYKEFKESKPGELTDKRSAIVSNESFARIAIDHKLYRHLIGNSEELLKRIETFISYIHTSENGVFGDWNGDNCPKVLGDILESLAGAVFVDGGLDLELVWEVFKPILRPMISSGKMQLRPVPELLELCQKEHFACSKTVSRECGRQCSYTFEVHVKSEIIKGTGMANDKKSAKRRAALDALAKLKDLGYLHPCKGESADNICGDAPGMKKQEPHLDMNPTVPLSSFISPSANYKKKESTVPCADDEESTFDGRQDKAHSIMSCTNSRVNMSTLSGPQISRSGSEPLLCGNGLVVDTESSSTTTTTTTGGALVLVADHVPEQEEEDEEKGPQPQPGLARTHLYRACDRKGWKAPSFTCSSEEGPPHAKWFTYDVMLQLPHVGQVQCSGDPCKATKAAMDSAAEHLLSWLASQGHLT